MKHKEINLTELKENFLDRIEKEFSNIIDAYQEEIDQLDESNRLANEEIDDLTIALEELKVRLKEMGE